MNETDRHHDQISQMYDVIEKRDKHISNLEEVNRLVALRIVELKSMLYDAAVRLERITYQHKEQNHAALSDKIRKALREVSDG